MHTLKVACTAFSGTLSGFSLVLILQALDMSVSFPMVKAILWFDELKVEAQAANEIVDWRFSANQQILSGLSTFIQEPAQSTGKKYWLQLSDFTSGGKPPCFDCSAWIHGFFCSDMLYDMLKFDCSTCLHCGMLLP